MFEFINNRITELEKEKKLEEKKFEKYIKSKIYQYFGISYPEKVENIFDVKNINNNSINNIILNAQKEDIDFLVLNECKKIEIILDKKGLSYNKKHSDYKKSKSEIEYIMDQNDNEKLLKEVEDNFEDIEKEYKELINILSKTKENNEEKMV